MPTPHNSAQKGDFAKVVLMPGDPLRAKYIAENFLVDAKLVNNVRGVNGYTGFTKSGKRVSVMASGMGMPSIGIYSHELYSEYGVEAIIRIGTSGSYQEKVHVGDIVLGMGACTNSAWPTHLGVNGTYSAIADYDLVEAAVQIGRERGQQVHCGNILSSDTFYESSPDLWKKWAAMGVLAVEMEAYALYANAAKLGKKALCLLTISDSFLVPTILSPEERQTGLNKMIELGIAVAERFA